MPLATDSYEVTNLATIAALNAAEIDEDGYAFLDEDYAYGCMYRRRRLRFRLIAGKWWYPIPPPRYSQA